VHFEPAGADATRFVARGLRYGFQITANEAIANADGKMVRLRFEGSKGASLEGQDLLRARTNILHGNDRTKWRRGIPNYARLVAHNVYPGIDVVYYSAGGELEYDLVVKPGADPRQIRMRVRGAPARLDEDGNLVAGLIHRRPATWQVAADGRRAAVESRFRKRAGGSFGFDLAKYDRNRELVIDPQLTLSVYVAGTSQDVAVAIGRDQNGFIYIGGTTLSIDLPVPDTAYQTANAGAAATPVTSDLFVAQIDPTQAPGNQLVYATYIGGSLNDHLNAMAVSASGTVYLTGFTQSTDFPLGNAAQSNLDGNSDAFIVWLDPSQAGVNALYYASYLGGADDESGNGIAVDSRGRILVTGNTNSPDFPTANAWLASLIGGTNAFIAVIDTTQSGPATLYYSTYMGGTNWDEGHGIAASPDGTVWITGTTNSGDYPLAGVAYQSNYGTGGDAFVTQINPDVAGGSSLLYSSYVGGSDLDGGNKIFVDPAGKVIVTGYTLSTDFPVTAGAPENQLAAGSPNLGTSNAFVVVLNPAATGVPASQLVYSTYLGGSGADEGYDVTEDAAGNIYASGMTKSSDFPVTAGALQPALLGGPAGFVVKLKTSKTFFDYSSYVTSDGNQVAYGVCVDPSGVIYVGGFTTGTLFDALGGTPQTAAPGKSSAFLMGFQP
jgi:hypothetical protein